MALLSGIHYLLPVGTVNSDQILKEITVSTIISCSTSRVLHFDPKQWPSRARVEVAVVVVVLLPLMIGGEEVVEEVVRWNAAGGGRTTWWLVQG